MLPSRNRLEIDLQIDLQIDLGIDWEWLGLLGRISCFGRQKSSAMAFQAKAAQDLIRDGNRFT